jgi:hypothetical protein
MNGIELIAIERQEQIEKHGFDVENDMFYDDKELIEAAQFALDPDYGTWPCEWALHFKTKIENKSYKDRLIVAGAFIAAELDRLNAKEA